MEPLTLYYAIDPQDFASLRAVAARLAGGSERERDEARRLSLVLDNAQKINAVPL